MKRGLGSKKVTELLLRSRRHEGRLDYFLNSRVRHWPTIGHEHADETSFGVGSTLTTTSGRKKDERWVNEVTCETTKTKIDDNQDSRSALAWSKRHTRNLKPQRMD
jgi:hypothetical protein